MRYVLSGKKNKHELTRLTLWCFKGLFQGLNKVYFLVISQLEHKPYPCLFKLYMREYNSAKFK